MLLSDRSSQSICYENRGRRERKHAVSLIKAESFPNLHSCNQHCVVVICWTPCFQCCLLVPSGERHWKKCSGGWCILVLPAQLFSLTSAVSAQGRKTLKLLFKQWANPYFSNNISLDLSVLMFCFVFPNIQNVWGGKHDFLFRQKRISGFLH